jgi:hypothetical protein
VEVSLGVRLTEARSAGLTSPRKGWGDEAPHLYRRRGAGGAGERRGSELGLGVKTG